jgi:hypothetical protein
MGLLLGLGTDCPQAAAMRATEATKEASRTPSGRSRAVGVIEPIVAWGRDADDGTEVPGFDVSLS